MNKLACAQMAGGFLVESDTGNAGLTCGIVMDVLRKIENIEIL